MTDIWNYDMKTNWNSVQHETVYNKPYKLQDLPLSMKKMKNAFSAWKQHLTPAAWELEL